MEPVKFTSGSRPKERVHYERIVQLDERLESELKKLQTTGRIPPSGDIKLLHPGLNFRRRNQRLIGLYLYWNSSFFRFLVSEEEFEIDRETDLYERARQKAALRSKQAFEEYFFSKFSSNDLFGNFLPRAEKLMKLMKIRRCPGPYARRKIRRRGYPSSVRRHLKIPIDGSLKHQDFSIKWPDSEAQRQEENCRLCERTLILSILVNLENSLESTT